MLPFACNTPVRIQCKMRKPDFDGHQPWFNAEHPVIDCAHPFFSTPLNALMKTCNRSYTCTQELDLYTYKHEACLSRLSMLRDHRAGQKPLMCYSWFERPRCGKLVNQDWVPLMSLGIYNSQTIGSIQSSKL